MNTRLFLLSLSAGLLVLALAAPAITASTEPVDSETPTAGVGATQDPATADAASNFSVTVTDTNAPLPEGESLLVNATVQNTGAIEGTQTVTLDAGELGTDSTTVTLNGSESTTETLSVATGAGDTGEYTATVSSENDSDEADVTVVPSVTVDIREPEQERAATAPVPLDIAIEGPDEGLSTFNITFEINQTASSVNASFTETSFNRSGLDRSTIEDDGSQARLATALLSNDYGPAEELVVAQLTLVTDAPGTVVVEAVAADVVGEDSSPSYAATFDHGNLTTVEQPPPFPGSNSHPADLTGDGLHGDVDGNGEVNLFDALTLFDNRNSIADEDVHFFKFSDSNPDTVTLFDALQLFDERNARSP